MNIGSVIKYYRTKNNLTQQHLAEGICSISHLSKIESNTYIPHESTSEALLAKMGVQWNKELAKYNLLQTRLGRFIDCALYYDLENMRMQYGQLTLENDYLQSTDLINQYELFKFRFYIAENDLAKAERQRVMLERLSGSFTAPENWLYRFFLSLHYSMSEKTETALKLLENLDQGIQSIPQKFEGEYYYQKARLLILRGQYELSAHFTQLAVQFYQIHHNYIRLLHAQLLLAINYTRRNLLMQASSIYEVLKRNSYLTGQHKLYKQTLYNYAELLKQTRNFAQARELLEELRADKEIGPYLSKAVLVSSIEIALETEKDPEPDLADLKKLIREDEEGYFKIYATYFEKRIFSQPDLLAYSEEIMFPFFRKYGYINERIKVAFELAAHYQKEKNWEKALFFSSFNEWTGGEII